MQALARGGGWLTPAEAHAVLGAMGISVLRTETVADEQQAIDVAKSIGYPVALKGFGPTVLHKSDVGAVRLDIQNEQALRAAHRDLVARLGTKLTGFVVQQMAPEGVEMFIGGLQDAVFGPVVFCGSGGVLVELFADTQCRLCPLTDRDVEEMLDEVRGIARLRGHRGRPVADEAALRDALVRVSALLDGCPEIQEMDINPVNVLTNGVKALDVRIRVEPPRVPAPTRRVRY